QPEHELAPGGASAANAALAPTRMPNTATETRVAFMLLIPEWWGGECRRPRYVARSISRHVDVVVLQRERADALSGRREVGVHHGRRRHADGRLADAAPESAGRHDDRFHLRHFGDAHRVVRVEVLLDHVSVLDGDLLIEQR